MKFKALFLVFYLFTQNLTQALADEGMWLPILLETLNEDEMQSMGFKLTAEDIYSINHGSMKDAVVLFGSGCTAEIVSDQGLILTNHHCGYGAIANHSSIDNDLLTNGFWAMSLEEELKNDGLTATILVRMEDVTARVMEYIEEGMTESERQAAIDKASQKIVAEATASNHYSAKVKAFYYGNEFYLFVYEVFEDVRLVGAPPSSIGKFGGDTDNWMWPRHTGDFCIFRIYSDKDNKPAKYSKDNIPYKPRYFFPISLKGIHEGDFTFVFGYPGTTQHYTLSVGVQQITEEKNPVAIKLRHTRMDIMEKYMAIDDATRIKYASKIAGVANYWKKMIGESNGIRQWNGIRKKIAEEEEFEKRVQANSELKYKYGNLMSAFKKTYKDIAPYNSAVNYFFEAFWSIEAVRYAWTFNKYISTAVQDPKSNELPGLKEDLEKKMEGHFNNVHYDIDREVCAAMLAELSGMGETFLPEYYFELEKKFKSDWTACANNIYANSYFTSKENCEKFFALKNKKIKLAAEDPMYKLASEFIDVYLTKIQPRQATYQAQLDSLYRIYIQALKEVFPEKRMWPDANSTLRVAYGKVQGYHAADAVKYKWFTTLSGVIEKEDPAIEDYYVDKKLKELYYSKNYGRYADADGTMHVGFIATNHTTGGNSGSPVLNAKGELVGINFDRVWEGTMSDLMFDPNKCRNIAVDIRYVLFIIDKYAGAGHLVDEMKLIK